MECDWHSIPHLIQHTAPHTAYCTSYSIPHFIQHTARHIAYRTSYSILHVIQHNCTSYSILHFIQHTTLHTAYSTSYSILHFIQHTALHTTKETKKAYMVVKITKILTCGDVHSTATKSLNSMQPVSIQPYIKHSETPSVTVTVQTHNMHTTLATWTLQTW